MTGSSLVAARLTARTTTVPEDDSYAPGGFPRCIVPLAAVCLYLPLWPFPALTGKDANRRRWIRFAALHTMAVAVLTGGMTPSKAPAADNTLEGIVRTLAADTTVDS